MSFYALAVMTARRPALDRCAHLGLRRWFVLREYCGVKFGDVKFEPRTAETPGRTLPAFRWSATVEYAHITIGPAL